MRYKLENGYTQLVTPKAVFQPPFAVRYRGRWYKAPYALRDRILAAFEPLDFGYRRLLDYLERTRRAYSELPDLPEGSLCRR